MCERAEEICIEWKRTRRCGTKLEDPRTKITRLDTQAIGCGAVAIAFFAMTHSTVLVVHLRAQRQFIVGCESQSGHAQSQQHEQAEPLQIVLPPSVVVSWTL
jgi:hypothetical protein